MQLSFLKIGFDCAKMYSNKNEYAFSTFNGLNFSKIYQKDDNTFTHEDSKIEMYLDGIFVQSTIEIRDNMILTFTRSQDNIQIIDRKTCGIIKKISYPHSKVSECN